MTNTVRLVWNWIGRNLLLLAVLGGALYALGAASGVAVGTVLQLVVFECVAIALSGFAALVFTRFNFIKEEDTHALVRIFQAVHLLVGLCVLGIYFLQWAPVGP